MEDYEYRNVRDDYFSFLCNYVNMEKKETSYYFLLKELFAIKFFSLVKRDEDRKYDGLELREEFVYEYAVDDVDENDICLGECTVLEMLIALAKRMSEEVYSPFRKIKYHTDDAFWELIDNLGLGTYGDDIFVMCDGAYCCQTTIECLLNREYSDNGEGGLFPLHNAMGDQREVEIWYQMQEYIKERF